MVILHGYVSLLEGISSKKKGIGKCPNFSTSPNWGYHHQEIGFFRDVKQIPQSRTFTNAWLRCIEHPFFRGQFWPKTIWVCLKIVYPQKPNGFADHYFVFKWLAIIGSINPTFLRQTTHIFYQALKRLADATDRWDEECSRARGMDEGPPENPWFTWIVLAGKSRENP